MTDTDMVIPIGILVAVLGFAFYKLAVRTKPKDGPGPHNNWRKKTNSSGWSENANASGSFDTSGGGGD